MKSLLSQRFCVFRYCFEIKRSRMIGQSKISSFFKSAGMKRQGEGDLSTSPSQKRLKEDDSKSSSKSPVPQKATSPVPKEPASPKQSPTSTPSSPKQSPKSTPASPPISPEQKSKMEDNKLNAKRKLLAKNTFDSLEHMGLTWFKALEPEFSKPYFLQLAKFVTAERQNKKIFPPSHQVFSFTESCELKDVKVVILGQDPYHGPGQAHGLCFSVQKGVPAPPSLKNMYKELTTDIEGFKDPGHGYLMGWARQGVLLLNAVLTVQSANANSHKDKGWEKFTDAIINHINKNLNGVVFMLWGSYAHKKGACIDKKRHVVLKGVHPSPLSAHRGYFGCKHFSKCNEALKERGKKQIEWKNLPIE